MGYDIYLKFPLTISEGNSIISGHSAPLPTHVYIIVASLYGWEKFMHSITRDDQDILKVLYA